MKVGVLGSGPVAQALASGFLKYKHDVVMGTRDKSKLTDFAKAHAGVRVGDFADAAQFGEVLVLAVKGTAAVDVLKAAGAANIKGKTVLDTTNPIADAPPVNGVIQVFTDPNESLMGQLQRQFPEANFVKAFSCVGSDSMVDPQFKGGQPTMFIAGNNAGARKTAASICQQFGWEVADMGTADAAQAIEPLAVLWCIPGFLENNWGPRAFKLLR
jgi:8-hydroxy-5-deazaflavin:NADPH oxidoreductase